MLGSKKMGRPTDNPKDISLKVRLDKTTAEKLDECIGELGVSKAEVVRRGVHKVHDDLEKKMKEVAQTYRSEERRVGKECRL